MKDGILTGGYTREQVVAANMDMVFVVCGLDDDFSPSRLERYLAISGSKGISPVVLLNKADLCGPETMEERLALARKSSGDAPIRVLSALTQGGSETVSEFLKPGMTGVLVGSSGVGKSTILNSLFESAVQKTSAISAANGKGRHTTTHRELFLLPGGGLIVDTPGLRELQLWATEDDLNLSFPDVMGELGRCRFSDCGHGSEPGCHVKDALAQGSLDPERYRSYNSLLREIRHLEARKDDLEARMGKRGKPAHGSVGIDISRRSRFPFW